MQQFRISPENLAKMKKKILIRFISLPLIGFTFAFIVGVINLKTAHVSIDSVYLVPCLLPLIYIGFSGFRFVRMRTRLLESYTLTLSDNLISREQHNTPDISIYFNDITEINKNKNGTFTIRSKNPQDIINVPVQIEKYNELEQLLNDIMLITEKRTSLLTMLAGLSPLILIGLMITVQEVQDKILATVCGTAYMALAAWCFYYVMRNKNADNKNKMRLLLCIVGLTALVIYELSMKLTLWN
jgi:hypothetical protein